MPATREIPRSAIKSVATRPSLFRLALRPQRGGGEKPIPSISSVSSRIISPSTGWAGTPPAPGLSVLRLNPLSGPPADGQRLLRCKFASTQLRCRAASDLAHSDFGEFHQSFGEFDPFITYYFDQAPQELLRVSVNRKISAIRHGGHRRRTRRNQFDQPHWFMHRIALCIVHTQLNQFLKNLRRLDPFGDHLHAKRVRDVCH